MHIIDNESIKEFMYIIIIVLVLITVIIWLIANNRTLVKNLKQENSLLKQQIKTMKQFDKKCNEQFNLIDMKFKNITKQLSDLEKGKN